MNHPDLTTLDAAELRYQVVASRRYLQRLLHVPVNSFCHPPSKYDAAVIAAVRAAGYSNATTEQAMRQRTIHTSSPASRSRAARAWPGLRRTFGADDHVRFGCATNPSSTSPLLIGLPDLLHRYSRRDTREPVMVTEVGPL